MKHAIRIFLCLGLLATLGSPAIAQFQLARSVFGNGGAPISGANHGMNGTLGQSVIGTVQGPAWLHQIGFWSISSEATPVDEQPATPSVFQLSQNQPNPFNPVTTIRYAIAETTRASLRLFDVNGRLVRELLNEEHAPGYYDFVLDAKHLSSGVYFYRLEAGAFKDTKKLILLK